MTAKATLLAAATPITATIALDVPIVWGGTTIETLKLRKPGTGELRGLKLAHLVEADTDAMLVLLSRITSPPLPVDVLAEKLDVADFVECCNQAAGFLPQRGRSTGSPTE